MIDESSDEQQMDENDCHLFSNLENLCKHFQTEHKDNHKKMVVAAQKHQREVTLKMD